MSNCVYDISYTTCITGATLSCYECLGPPGRGCADSTLADFVKIPCSQEKFMKKPYAEHMELENAVELSGLCVQALIVQNNATVAERGCAFIPPGMNFCETLSRVVEVKSCSTCTQDYCNKKRLKHYQIN
ncbi:serine protease family s1c htra-related [Holotrichia oblita]|uniref:Serine protease family s1c htra-related n=1 Tax=Holotrichia oblita TaxID=644536 RepID=A0ACB9TUB2_HOLOL|nr:serine protease family s1c htra-related [Holotrichia oblita]